jgi:hypothetical protein
MGLAELSGAACFMAVSDPEHFVAPSISVVILLAFFNKAVSVTLSARITRVRCIHWGE